MKILCIILLLSTFIKVDGQITRNNSDWMDYLKETFDNEETFKSSANLLEELSAITMNPYNLQTVTKEELEKLPFLSDQQIENMLYYIYKYGPLVDIYELKNVEDLDIQTILYLLPFVYISKPEQGKSYITYKNLKQEILLKGNFTQQEKAGYSQASKEEQTTSPNKHYPGNPVNTSLRYNLNIQDKIQFGITGEKDAGESFRKKYPYGLDFYTYNILLKDLEIIKELHFGNYRLSFGQGLVINNHFSMGKIISDAVNINQKNTGIKRHLSTNEDNYFSGIAVKMEHKNYGLYLFYSNKAGDGNADSLNIYSIKTDGLHRTYKDLIKRKAFSIEMAGNHLSWKNDFISLGFTSIYYSFSGKKLNPDHKPYNLFYLRDKDHFNFGISFDYRVKKIKVKGETAIDKSGKVATLTNLSYKPASFISGVISWRYYDKAYNAFFGKSFGESSSVQNESGIYMGLQFNLSRNWTINSYLDCCKFPWIKYGINTPSSGEDIALSTQYIPHHKVQFRMDFRIKEKHRNLNIQNIKTTQILPHQQKKIKYRMNFTPNTLWKLKSEIHSNLYSDKNIHSKGWCFNQSGTFITPDSKFQIDGGITYFQTEDWNTRVNIYEKNVLYSFNFTNFYGNGLRYYLVLKWNICKPLTFYFKYASCHYFDRQQISSGTEEIDGPIKSDIYGSIRYKF